jgi:serine/threonine-protein kinase
MTTCPSTEKLQQLLNDKLSDEEYHAIEAHVETCPACKEILDRLTNSVQAPVLPPPPRDPTPPSGAERAAGAEEVLPTLPEPAESAVRYRPVRFHARGGLGEVFRAQDEQLGREVALKRMKAQYATDADSRRRFLREAEITSQLEHPGIVPVHGLAHTGDGLPCYTMRFIEGETLQEAIQRFHEADKPNRDPGERSLALRQLLHRLITVCNTVAYAHSRGVVHRDIKPENIMVGKYGETLVVDWGLAKPFAREETVRQSGEATVVPRPGQDEGDTKIGEQVGTPAYMSPEQAEGRWDVVGPASDIFSLGATLYAVLTGKAPFSGGDVLEALENARPGDFRLPRQVKKTVPPALEAICLKTMARKPAERYATAQDLASDLEHWLADEPVGAYREPISVRARRWVGRHRVLVSGAVAAVLVAAVSLGVATVLLEGAYKREREAKNEVEMSYKREQEAKNKADKSFQQAQRVVGDYTTKVSEDERLKERDVEPLRKALLEMARVHYQRFVDERADDPSVQADLAWAYERLANITKQIDTETKAIELYHKALAIFEQLALEHPDVADYQKGLAHSHLGLGSSYRSTGRMDEAERHHKLALGVYEKLAIAYPSEVQYKHLLMLAHDGLCLVYMFNEQRNQVEKHRQESLEIAKKLFIEDPSDAHQGSLAHAHSSMASFYSRANVDKAKEHYEKAWKIRKQLLSKYPSDARAQFRLASLDGALGSFYISRGQAEEARKHLEEAMELSEQVAKRHPNITNNMDLLNMDLLAQSHHFMGDLYRNKRETNEAEKHYKRELEIRKELTRQDPESARFRENLATGYLSLSLFYRGLDRWDQAEEACQRAKPIYEQLASRQPPVPAYQVLLAVCCQMLADTQQVKGQIELAERNYQKALEIFEELVRVTPEDVTRKTYLGGFCCAMGHRLRDKGEPQVAVSEWYARALRILEPLLKPDQQNTQVKQNLLNAYVGRAETWSRLGRHEDAVKDLDQALAMDDGELQHLLKFLRAVSLARQAGGVPTLKDLGEYAQIATETDAWLQQGTFPGGALYDLAGVYAQCRGAALNESKRSPADREKRLSQIGALLVSAPLGTLQVLPALHLQLSDPEKLAEHYAERAVQLLEKAQTAAYFQVPANFDYLEKDPLLAPLREHPGFKKFFQKVSEERKPLPKPAP